MLVGIKMSVYCATTMWVSKYSTRWNNIRKLDGQFFSFRFLQELIEEKN